MKVLHTISGLSNLSGGPSSCTFELVRALNAVGCNTDILAIAPPEGGKLLSNEPFIHTVPRDVGIGGYSANFRQALREHAGYDVMHINGLWLYSNWCSAREAQLRQIPYVWTLHGMLYPHALNIRKYVKHMFRFLWYDSALKKASCIHATCIEELKHYRALGFRNPVAVIPNCLAVPENLGALRTASGSRGKRIGFLGRFHPIKNLELLIDAWADSGALASDAELLLAGGGDADYTASLKKRVKDLGLDNVRFVGFLNGDDKYRFVASLRALALVSKMENFGMVVPEALMLGTPVIAGDRTPWRTIAEHRCGWFTASHREALVESLNEALAMPEAELVVMGERGKALFEVEYSAPTVATRMFALYRYLLEGGEIPPFVDVVDI